MAEMEVVFNGDRIESIENTNESPDIGLVGHTTSTDIGDDTKAVENTVENVDNPDKDETNTEIKQLNDEIKQLREALSKMFINSKNVEKPMSEPDAYIFSENSMTSRILKSNGIKEDK